MKLNNNFGKICFELKTKMSALYLSLCGPRLYYKNTSEYLKLNCFEKNIRINKSNTVPDCISL